MFKECLIDIDFSLLVLSVVPVPAISGSGARTHSLTAVVATRPRGLCHLRPLGCEHHTWGKWALSHRVSVSGFVKAPSSSGWSHLWTCCPPLARSCERNSQIAKCPERAAGPRLSTAGTSLVGASLGDVLQRQLGGSSSHSSPQDGL